jgi:hypothetical protein
VKWKQNAKIMWNCLAYGLSKLPSQEHAIPCFILDSCPGILFQEKRACKKCKCNSAFFVTLSSAPQFSFWTSFGISSGSSWGKEIRHFDISCTISSVTLLKLQPPDSYSLDTSSSLVDYDRNFSRLSNWYIFFVCLQGTNIVDKSHDQDTTDLHKCVSFVTRELPVPDKSNVLN